MYNKQYVYTRTIYIVRVPVPVLSATVTYIQKNTFISHISCGQETPCETPDKFVTCGDTPPAHPFGDANLWCYSFNVYPVLFLRAVGNAVLERASTLNVVPGMYC